MKRAVLAAALFVTVLAGCRHGGDGAPTPAQTGSRAPVLAEGEVEAAYVAGDLLHGSGASSRLGSAVAWSLVGNLAPAAVPDPAGRRLAYNSWRRDRPVLRLRELMGGAESVVAEGAYSPAWRRDGALAYFQALRPQLRDLEATRHYRGHVVVRESPDAEPVRWTRQPARYVVAAWADERLLAYRLTSGWPEILVIEGPGRARVLAEASALVAVSPDGGRVFVSTYGATPPLVRVVDLATRAELARAEVPDVQWLTEAGSWAGKLVVAASTGGVVVFRVGEGTIELEQAIRLDRLGFPVGLFEPQLDETGRRITAWGQLEDRPRQAFAGAAVVECDRVELRCVRGPEVSSALGPRLVYDPSRP